MEQNRYPKAKIYKIVCNITGVIFVGSTCKKLCQRIAQHREYYKQYLKGKHNYVTLFKVLKMKIMILSYLKVVKRLLIKIN
jgi:hypothetical protein